MGSPSSESCRLLDGSKERPGTRIAMVFCMPRIPRVVLTTADSRESKRRTKRRRGRKRRTCAFAVTWFAQLAGCADSADLRASPRVPDMTPCLPGASLAAVTWPYDAPVSRLTARIVGVDGREGYYAKEQLSFAAKDRDELLRVLLVRDHEIERCVSKSAARDHLLWESGVLMAALTEGANPAILTQRLGVTDVRLPPRAMPFGDRACSGHGLEGAASCLVFGPLGAILDLISWPIGTWFWAGRESTTGVSLDEFPPSPELLREVDDVVRRRSVDALRAALE